MFGSTTGRFVALTPNQVASVAAYSSTLVVGIHDPRVPLYETEQLVKSVERRGHPVQMLVFDDEGHGLSKRPNRIEGYAEVVAFLNGVAGQQGDA